MFLSKYDEETVSNRRVAKDLIDRWSRVIFNRSARYSDLRNDDDIHVPVMKKPVTKPPMVEVKACDLDVNVSKEQKLSSRPSSMRQHVTRPETASLVYTVRPQSKYNPEIARTFARQQRVQGDSRQRIEQRLKQLKASRKKPLQAAKLSAEGRRMLLSMHINVPIGPPTSHAEALVKSLCFSTVYFQGEFNKIGVDLITL
ncbi:hypothetical protein SCA6_018857 [Theobroma cacao]